MRWSVSFDDGKKEVGMVEAGGASLVEGFLSVIAGPPSDGTEGVGREDGLGDPSHTR
jgi:hypothetical protein